MRDLRTGTLQWAAGIFCTVFGALMLVVPHQFRAAPYAALQAMLPLWGIIFLLGGAALLGAAVLAPARWLVLASHLLAGVALLVVASGFVVTGAWAGMSVFFVLGLAVAVSPLVARPSETSQHPSFGNDLFALVMGASAALAGLVMLVAPSPLIPPAIASILPWYGGVLVASGALLAYTQLRTSSPLALQWAAHLVVAAALLTYLALFAVPSRSFSTIVYYGGFGTALAVLPWLGPRLRGLDPSSLRMRLTLALTFAAALPLTWAVALISDQSERLTVAEALGVQQTLAAAHAQHVGDFIAVHRAAVVSLAGQPGLLETTPEAQQGFLRSFGQAYPDTHFFLFDAQGKPLAGTDDLTPVLFSGLGLFEPLQPMDLPAVEAHFPGLSQQPVLVFRVPIRDAGGQLRGLVLALLEASGLAALFHQTEAVHHDEVYLVDGRGRVFAHSDRSLPEELAELSEPPPVSSLLAGIEQAGSITYRRSDGDRIAGFARVPGTDWGVVIERPKAVALAASMAGRELAFAALLVVIVAAAVLGTLAAEHLAAPLRGLARAVDKLAAGSVDAPLPNTSITEVRDLAVQFGEMRSRLVARTQELQQAEARFRALVEAAPDATVVTDAAGRITLVNQQAERLFGYDRHELIGHPVEVLVPQSLREAHVGHRSAYMADPYSGQMHTAPNLLARRKDGSEFPVEVNLSTLDVEGGMHVAAVVHDMTERLRAEAERAQLIREQAARAEAEASAKALKQLNSRLVRAHLRAQALADEARAVTQALRQRDAILEAVAFAADRLLVGPHWQENIQEVLRQIGKAARVSRVYIFHNHPGEDGQMLTSQLYEWVAPGIVPQIDNPDLRDFPYHAAGFGRWADTLAQGNLIQGHVRDFPESERQVLASQDIRSIVVVPIFVERNWWGFIGFDECGRERAWSAQETEALRMAARTIGSAIRREQAEAERAQLVLEQAARAQAQEAHQRLAFLAEVTRVLVSSLDYDVTLQSVARMMVPTMGDACIVDIIEGGSLRHVAVAHVDPSKEALVREMRRRFPPDPSGPHPAMRVLRAGRPEVHHQVLDPILTDIAQSPEHLEMLRQLRPRSAIYVPLLAREGPLGVVTFSIHQSDRWYKASDLALAEEVARRAGMAVDNARLYRQAQDALRARQEFLATVSHDLKNPLTAIRGWTSILRRRGSDPIMPNQETKALDEIANASEEMRRMIDQLLDAARLEAGHELQLQLAQVDLWALADRLVEQQRATTDRHQLHLVGAGPGQVIGRWDAGRLEQVVANLLSNAIKYSPAGGTVEVRVVREGPVARLAVRDEGIGIPKEAIPHLFEPFYRARNVAPAGTGPKVGGLGLGLFGAQRIAQSHGGRIEVTSQEGHGSTFTLVLPLSGPAHAPPAPSPEASRV